MILEVLDATIKKAETIKMYQFEPKRLACARHTPPALLYCLLRVQRNEISETCHVSNNNKTGVQTLYASVLTRSLTYFSFIIN